MNFGSCQSKAKTSLSARIRSGRFFEKIRFCQTCPPCHVRLATSQGSCIHEITCRCDVHHRPLCQRDGMLPHHMAADTAPFQAIDFMYYVATPEFIARWNKAKKGELICRMERAIGGLPQFPSIESMMAGMNAAGVERVFIAQCKMWSYRRKWMYMDTRLEEVLQYTQSYPDRFSGLAGYDPFHISESLREIETAVTQHGFRGVYVHIYGFDIPLHDRKMYPLYAKCVELDVPVSLQVGHVLEAMPSDCARPIYLDRVACDFPDLKLVGAHTGWPWVEELISVCYKWENVWLGVDAWMPKYLSPPILQFLNSRLGQDRCLWGTNGLPWQESLQQVDQLGLKPESKRKLLYENAARLFKLEGPAAQELCGAGAASSAKPAATHR